MSAFSQNGGPPHMEVWLVLISSSVPKRVLNEVGVDTITARILTNETNFTWVDPDSVGLDTVAVKRGCHRILLTPR